MAGMEAPRTPEQIGRQAGFATGAANAPMPATAPVPRSVLAPTPTPMKAGPSAGTTELVPGATDWVKNLVVQLFSPPAAHAAPALPAPVVPNQIPAAGAAPAPGSLSRINGAFPQGMTPKPGGLDWGALWRAPPTSNEGGVRG